MGSLGGQPSRKGELLFRREQQRKTSSVLASGCVYIYVYLNTGVCAHTHREEEMGHFSQICVLEGSLYPHLYGLCKSVWLETGNVSRVATTIIQVEIMALVIIVQ